MQTSTDGSAWTTVKAAAGYRLDSASGNAATMALTPLSARYVRLAFSANTGWPAGQLARFEVYAS